MNKKIAWIAGFLVLAAIGTFAYWFYSTKDQRARREAVVKLPAIEGVDAHGQAVNNEVIEGEKGVLVFISLTCPYCQEEVKAIRDNMASFNGHPVYLISQEEAIHGAFAEDFEIMDIEGLHLVKTGKEAFRNFQVTKIPQTFIYDKKGKLIERIEGYAPLELITEHL